MTNRRGPSACAATFAVVALLACSCSGSSHQAARSQNRVAAQSLPPGATQATNSYPAGAAGTTSGAPDDPATANDGALPSVPGTDTRPDTSEQPNRPQTDSPTPRTGDDQSTPHRSRASGGNSTPPPGNAERPTVGPSTAGSLRLVRGYLVKGPAGCHLDSIGNAVVGYRVVLDVHGSTAQHAWQLAIPFADAANHLAAAVSTRAIAGGREFVFETSTVLEGPDHAPVQLTTEDAIDADANPPAYDFTRLRYRSGGVLITDRYCS